MSPNFPAIGCATAMIIRYIVTTQVISEIETDKSDAIVGNPTAIIVELTGTKKVPVKTANSINL